MQGDKQHALDDYTAVRVAPGNAQPNYYRAVRVRSPRREDSRCQPAQTTLTVWRALAAAKGGNMGNRQP